MRRALLVLFAVLLLVTPALADDLKTSLVSYWNFAEESGTREDAHGSNDLTDNNTVLYAEEAWGNAADFERDNSEYLSIADASQTGLDLTGDMSFSLWVRLETQVPNWSGYTIISKWATDNKSYTISYYHDTNRYLLFQATSNGWDEANPNGVWQRAVQSLDAGTLYHLVVTFDASEHTATWYVNASPLELASTQGTITSVYNGSAPFHVGATSAGGSCIDGRYGPLGVWSRVLTSDDVTALYNSGTPLLYSELVPPSTMRRRTPIIW